MRHWAWSVRCFFVWLERVDVVRRGAREGTFIPSALVKSFPVVDHETCTLLELTKWKRIEQNTISTQG